MLWKKVLRDIKENKGAYFACVLVIAVGIMVYTSFSMVIDNLYLSQQSFYEKQLFADGFVEVDAIPLGEIAKLQDIEGIKDIQGRLIKDVRVLWPEEKEETYLRLVSLTPDDSQRINDVLLTEGTELSEREMNIWIDNKFFEANNLELHQEIQVIIAGKKRSLQIAGAGKSPEFIYALRTINDLYPNPETFGIAFIPYKVMKNMFGEGEIVNNIVFTLREGADYSEVESSLKPDLKKYGLKSIYPRKNQTSHLLLSQEIQGLESTAQSLPVIFLGVAGMILYILLKRTIEQQRGQIGILKAFGFTPREIILHYLSYALIIGLFGGIIGGLLGIALSYPYTSMYEIYFNMPGLESEFSFSYLLTGIIFSVVIALFAGYQGSKGVLHLEPAEALRPAAPLISNRTLLERIEFLWNMLNVQGKMALRNLARNKSRSGFIFIGIVFTFALSGLPYSMYELSTKMLFDQYEKIETYDVKVSLTSPTSGKSAARELDRYPGVKRLEKMAEIPVTFKNKWYKKDVLLLGIEKNSKLYNIMDKKQQRVTLPSEGILISERLAKLLDADIGTELVLESYLLKDREENKKVIVAGIVPQYLGLNAYMELSSTQELLEQGDIITSLLVSIKEENISVLQEDYKNSGKIAGISDRIKFLQQSKELMASFSGMIAALAIFGIITGFAVTYSSFIINLSERSREISSMMVLGMTSKEVLSVITFEQWFLAGFAMLFGIPLTKLMLVGMAEAVSNDVYTMPTYLSPTTIFTALMITVASILFAQFMAGRKIKKLDFVEALKSRE